MSQESMNNFLRGIVSNPFIFILFFLAMGFGICFALSYFSGWRKLARYYRYQNEVISKKKYFQTAGIREVHYGSCLTIGGNEQGLYLSILFLFAAGSPKLFIPWSDIKIVKKRYLWFRVLELSIVRAPSVKVVVFQSIEKFLQEICGRSLIIEGVPYR